ncbi:MAG TPA: ADOP family duplicated permease [Bryobacteraceae bacterium]|nr:ADOP family duplicated permease [Bryobacteraceae bacterium]
MPSLLEDIRYSVRTLWKKPATAAVVFFTLLVGIVLNTSVFSICNVLWFRPLPFKNPDQLVVLLQGNPRQGSERLCSQRDFDFLRQHARTVEALSAAGPRGFNLSSGWPGGPEPRDASGAAVTDGFIETLGFRPIAGRLFTTADFQAGAPQVVLISERLWRTWLAGADVVGSQVSVDREKATIVGILPRNFRFLTGGYDVVTPLTQGRTQREVEANNLIVLARMRPQQAPPAMQAEMTALMRERLTGEAGWGLRVFRLRDQYMREARILYPVLLAAAWLILLIVCANISNLLLARSAARRKEMALRLSLGAPRSEPARLVLVEGVLLAVLAGAAALPVCLWIRNALVAAVPDMAEIVVDWRVMGFTLLAALLAGLVFAIGPALSVLRIDVNAALKEEGAGVSRRSAFRLRRALVAGEMAVAMVMLTGTGLLLRAVAGMLTVDAGFRSAGTLVARANLPPAVYPDTAHRAAALTRLSDAVRAMPGVDSVAVVSSTPMQGEIRRLRLEVADRPAPPEGETIRAALTSAGPGYFRTAGVPLVRGREFTEQDDAGGPGVAILNRTLVKALWGEGANVLGQRLRTDPKDDWLAVVGVVGDTRQDLMREPFPEVYVPYRRICPPSATLVVGTRLPPEALAGPVRAALRALDPELPFSGLRSLEDLRRDYIPPVYTIMLAAFSLLALALVFVGLYGLVSFYVVESTREIGVRISLGALPRNVLALVVRQGVRLAVIGVLIGLAGSIAVGKLLSGLLPTVIRPFDAGLFLAVSATLLSVAVAASLIPARRAIRLDPAANLRHF